MYKSLIDLKKGVKVWVFKYLAISKGGKKGGKNMKIII